MNIELAFLGTGTCNSSGRNPASFALSNGSEVVLLDAGGGAYHQLSRLESPAFNYKNISTIFISHFHVDHISGLPDLLWGEMWDSTGRRENPLIIAGPHGLRNFYNERLLPFMGDYPLPFEIQLIELSHGETFSGSFFTATSHHLEHGEFSTGYLFDFGDKCLAYTGDTGYCDNLIELIKKADSAIIEWSISDYASYPGHLSSSDFAKLIKLGIFPGTVYINHMYIPSGSTYEFQVKKNREILGDFSERVIFPQDLDIITIKEKG